MENIRKTYHIPRSVSLVAPEAQWRACAPPVGYGTLYVKYLEFGFRLPFHPFWEQIVSHYHVALGKITPSGVFCITHFLAGCASEKVTPTLDLFRYHFQVKRSPKEFGWVTVSSRSDRVFKVKNPDTARKWKPDFLFFRVNDSVSTLSEEWYFGDISDSWNEKNPIPEGEEKLAKLGLRRGGITEEDFISYGLSPAEAEEMSETPPKPRKKRKGRF